MNLTCNNKRHEPYTWNYQGKALYASCPKCRGSVRVKGK